MSQSDCNAAQTAACDTVRPLVDQNFRFPKSLRLLTSKEFRKVSSQSNRVTTHYFTLLVRKTSQMTPRIGITVSRKVGNAVTRNRIKRVTREFFRLQRARFQPDLEFVVIAKPLAGKTINAELTTSLHHLLIRFTVA